MKKINKIRINNFEGLTPYGEEGETLIKKVARILDENEPITDGAPLVYTEKKDGVLPQYDIRSDKWKIAMDAMDKVNKHKVSEYLKQGTVEELGQKQDENSTTETSQTAEPKE